MSGDPFASLSGGVASASSRRQRDWVPVLPVPYGAPSRPLAHEKRGKPNAVWEYVGPDGQLWGYVCRFDGKGGAKDILPLTFCERGPHDKPQWRWKSLPVPRPLYRLDMIAQNPDAPVLVCEGEKAVDAATMLAPEGWIVTTSPSGSNAANKSDWILLTGRKVVVWPDADEAGEKYARDVVRLAKGVGATEVLVIPSPDGVAKGWDAADAVSEDWTADQVNELVASAKPSGEVFADTNGLPDTRSPDASKGGAGAADHSNDNGDKPRRPKQVDEIMSVIGEDTSLWHDPDRKAWITFTINNHKENWSVRDHMTKVYLSSLFYKLHGSVPGSQAMEDALKTMEGIAIFDRPEHQTYVRIADCNGDVYVDLGNSDWNGVEITASGWRVIDEPPVKFVRSPSSKTLPVPVVDDSQVAPIERLKDLANIGDEANFKMAVGWIIGAYRPKGPYPLLVLSGEQGSGKSSFSKLLRSLVDPAKAPIRTAPKEERDLLIAARNNWCLAFDNLSHVPEWFSDGLCRLSTGGGFGARELYTDWGEAIFEGQRPMILNGIPDLAGKPDLGDRSIAIHLPSIPEDKRRPESEWDAEVDAVAPILLGGIFDGVSAALRRERDIKLTKLPRMADFAKWVTAAEEGLGWGHGSFIECYESNRADVVSTAVESNPMVGLILDLLETDRSWKGTATGLLQALGQLADDALLKGRWWPKNARTLSSRLRVAAPLLRGVDVEIHDYRDSDRKRTRMIVIERKDIPK